jgi:predicted MFS family arabinose efflux permease
MSPSNKRDFGALWAATTVSHFGTMLGALTLTAVVYLHASPSQMGVLLAAGTAPTLLIALLAGVWIDRLARRAVMLVADGGRFAVLLTVPLAALLGALRMEQLYFVAFVSGCLEVLFNLASRAILPELVKSDQLVKANARLQMSTSVAESISPTIGGGVVQAAGGPVAVLLDALSYLASGVLLLRVRSVPKREPTAGSQGWQEALQGLRTAVRQPVLRAILGMSCTYGLFGSFLITLFELRVLTELGLSPLALGLLAVGGGLGSFAGAGLVPAVTRRAGLGPTITSAYLLAVLFDLSIPLAGGPVWLAFAILFGGYLFSNVFYALENVTSLSLRQAVTADAQMGRVNAVFLVADRALRPVGALLAGVVAERLGIQATLFVGAAGMIGASAWLFLSPLPRIKSVDDLRRQVSQV